MGPQRLPTVAIPEGEGAEALRGAVAPLEAVAELRGYAATADEEPLVRGLAGARVALSWLGRTRLTRGVLERLPELRLVSVAGPWLELVDLDAAKRLGIQVLHTPGMAISAVTEFTLALMLAWHRPLPLLAQGAGASPWGLSPGRELRGRKLGVVGLGAIGADVAKRALGLGMEVAAWSPSLTPERAREHGVEARALPELLADADVVSLHLRLGPETERLVGRDFLRQMKRTALLINTSRAGLLDEDALWEALSESRLAGAALDVHGQEPLPVDSRWFRLRNVLLTPHCAWSTEETWRRMAEQAVANALAFLRDAPGTGEH